MIEKEKLEKRELSKYGDLFTLEEFKNDCLEGYFNNYDGTGLYSDGVYEYGNPWENTARPSDFISGKNRTDFSHVVWFNK
jgi:hypothetical protein